MKKYRKSLLSVAASVAISSSILSGGYLPLTDATHDDTWVLIGVSSFAGSQSQAANEGDFSIITSTSNTWLDTDKDDDLADTGGSNISGLGSLEALNTEPVEVRVNTSGYTLSQTDPVRRMYVKDSEGAILFSFEYKASLEGETLEYKVNNIDTAYFVAISSDNTYDNPALGVITPSTVGGTDSESLVSLEAGDTFSAVDFNLTNNPMDSAKYDVSVYRDEDANDSIRMYSFDPSNDTWNLFDTRNSVSANDFTEIEVGKGYWASMDTNDDHNRSVASSGQLAGLVLGDGSTSISYVDSGLEAGWNLISFDSENTEIRVSTTGMLATYGNGTITLYDSSMNASVDVLLAAGDDVTAANAINYAITKAKVDGSLPRIFDLKAFATGTTGEIALVSNKRFGIEPNDAAVITNLTSMTAGNLLVSTGGDFTAGDPGTLKYMSVYNEYFLLIEPLVGAGTAAGISDLSAKLDFNIGADQTIVDINNTIAEVATAISGVSTTETTATVSAITLDVNSSGTQDYVLISATEPFYIRDYTASRVFKYVEGIVTDSNVSSYLTGIQANQANILLAGDTNATDAAEDINASTGLVAQSIDNEYFVVVALDNNASNSSVDFALLYESGGDKLAVTEADGTIVTTSSDLAKGAVKAVYAINSFVKAGIINNVDINVSTMLGNDTNVTMSYLNMLDFNLTGAVITQPADIAALLAAVTTDLTDYNVTATVTADGNDTLHFTGSSIINVSADANGTSTTAGTGLTGYLDTSNVAKMTDDLKYNSEYSPNYVTSGPLYTMREAGFKLEALVTGVTDIATGDISWESIDLTRPTFEWLDSQDYNLFDTDERSGYWAYLSTQSYGDISLTNPIVAITGFTHYYDAGVSTTLISGSLDVTIEGIDNQATEGQALRVIAKLGGKNIELTLDTGTTYTGKINMYEISTDPLVGEIYDIIVNVYDGIGNTYTTNGVVEIALDAEKPEKPLIEIADGVISIGESNSTDVAAYYVFAGEIPEYYEAGDEVSIEVGSSTLTGLCATSSAITINSLSTGYNVVAVDRNGTEGMLGNASDIASVTYMAIGKSRVILEDINDDDSIVSTGGSDYNSSCEQTATYTTNVYGVSLTSETVNKNVKIAFTPDSLVDPTDLPITVFVTDGTNLARIDYSAAYVGTEMFFMMNDETYGITFPTRIEATNTSSDTADAWSLGTAKTGVAF